MPAINDIVERMIDWLGQQQLTPAPREITPVGLLPAAAYPQVAVLVEGEEFAPGDASVTAELTLRVAHALGRPADAQAAVRDLAHQSRVALNESHGLGGTVKRLRTGGISYEAQQPQRGVPPVIATASLTVELKYCVAVVGK